MTKHIAIIPARSGSKGLPHKNIKALNGIPLLAYSIKVAQESGIYDEIFVSTDSTEYAEIAQKWGANVPFLRDPLLAGDLSSTWDAVKSDLCTYSKLGKTFDMVTLLQPTSPLRSSQDLIECLHLFKRKQADAIISVCEAEHSPLLCNTLNTELSMNNFIDSTKLLARQALGSFYRLNGAIYMISTKHLSSNQNLYSPNSYAYIMPKERSVDIDDAFDFFVAEALLASNM